MTTPPLHNTDASIDELFDMTIIAKQVAVTTVTGEMDIWLENGEIAEQANVLLERYRAEFRNSILSLLAEARTTERKSFESIVFQACDNANLSGPDKRDVMQFVTEALLPKESK